MKPAGGSTFPTSPSQFAKTGETLSRGPRPVNMKKPLKSKAVPKVDPYIDGLMAKLLERLTGLEKKMDTVVSYVARMDSAGGNQPKVSQVPLARPQAPRHERMMYEAICAECSKVCEVPFRPSESRPVYCKECWAKRKGGGGPSSAPGMPVLRPVSLPPKPASKLSAAAQAAPGAANQPPKKAKKSKPAKKAKKRRSRTTLYKR